MGAPSSPTMPTWRTLDEASKQLRLSRRTITRWIKDGSIRVYEIPGDRKHYVDLDEIKKFRQPRPIERKEGGAP